MQGKGYICADVQNMRGTVHSCSQKRHTAADAKAQGQSCGGCAQHAKCALALAQETRRIGCKDRGQSYLDVPSALARARETTRTHAPVSEATSKRTCVPVSVLSSYAFFMMPAFRLEKVMCRLLLSSMNSMGICAMGKVGVSLRRWIALGFVFV